jgi:hypothetical protein
VPLSEGVGLGRLSDLFADPAVLKIFQREVRPDFLAAAGIATANIFDTMLAEKVLTRGANQSASR